MSSFLRQYDTYNLVVIPGISGIRHFREELGVRQYPLLLWTIGGRGLLNQFPASANFRCFEVSYKHCSHIQSIFIDMHSLMELATSTIDFIYLFLPGVSKQCIAAFRIPHNLVLYCYRPPWIVVFHVIDMLWHHLQWNLTLCMANIVVNQILSIGLWKQSCALLLLGKTYRVFPKYSFKCHDYANSGK